MFALRRSLTWARGQNRLLTFPLQQRILPIQLRQFTLEKIQLEEAVQEEVKSVEAAKEEHIDESVAVSDKSKVSAEVLEETQKVAVPQGPFSWYQKLNMATKNEDGSYTHQFCKANNGKPRKFKDERTFTTWHNKHRAMIKGAQMKSMSPHQWYITQCNGTERAFTGEYVWNLDVGTYECVCCTQRIFLSEHKYQNKSGYATFWNTIKSTVRFTDDHLKITPVTNAHVDPTLKYKEPAKRVTCSNCESHLGHVFTDGPAPYGFRFQINSAAINFLLKPWFQIPVFSHKQIRVMKKTQYLRGKVRWLKRNVEVDEKMMKRKHYSSRLEKKVEVEDKKME